MHDEFNARSLRYNAAPSDASAQELIDAAERLLHWRSELPHSTAIRLLKDIEAKKIHEVAHHALCMRGLTTLMQAAPLNKRLTDGEELVERSFGRAMNLAPLIKRSIDDLRTLLPLREYDVRRALSMQSISACTAEIRLSSQEQRVGQLRADAGVLALNQFALLERRTQLAQWLLRDVSGHFPPALKDAVLDEKGAVRTLAHLSADIVPAMRSTAFGDAERAPTELGNTTLGLGNPGDLPMGHPLDRDNQQVLEAAIDRLREFAVGVEELRAKLIEHSAPTRVHDLDVLDVLSEVAEDTWFMASTLSKRLMLDQEAPVQAPTAALPAGTTSSSAGPRKNKGKAKARQREHGPSAATNTAQPAVVPGNEETLAPAPKRQLVRSKLGTPMLLSTEEAAKAAAAAEAMKQRQQDLDELLAVDVSARQRALVHARDGVSPENGTYAVKEIIKEITGTAAAMKDCLTHLAAPKKRMALVAPSRLHELHTNTIKLEKKLNQLEGVAKDTMSKLEVAELDHVKTYRLPKQEHIERMFHGGHLTSIGKPQALQGNPGNLFEVKLQPSPLRSGAVPRPIWLHIHTHAPVHSHQLAKLDNGSFAASHVKTTEERGRGRKWQNARAAEGYEHVQIHRGKVSPELCKALLGQPQ